MSVSNTELVKHLYGRFNARDIDGVLAQLTEDVAWANGMDGGHAHRHDGVREYWTRQWAMISPHVEPVAFQAEGADLVTVEVIQTVFDLEGKPLTGQTHGLKDKTVMHIFSIRGGKIARFDIGEDA